MTQLQIPCAVYRGGTSRGLFFHEKDLPQDDQSKRKVFLKSIDAFNDTQIDGLGSATSHTSKIVVIDVVGDSHQQLKYTFYQIGIGEQIVDSGGTCGNLMAAVGAFVVNEQLLDIRETRKSITVNILNTNINKEVNIEVPLKNGVAKVKGSYLMPGVVTTGAKYKVKIMHPGGTKTAKTLPLGRTNTITVNKQIYNVSLIDLVNPFIYISALDLNLTGKEMTRDIISDRKTMLLLNQLRDQMTVKIGFSRNLTEAKQHSPAIPKIAMVAKPQDYLTTSGKKVFANEVDIIAKMISMGRLHRTFAGSGLYNLAAATLLSGTIPNEISKLTYHKSERLIRIGHPDGIAKVYVTLTDDHKNVLSVGLARTARLIMEGHIYVPE